MTSLEMSARFVSTSASGAMGARQAKPPMLLGCMLVGLGTSSVPAAAPDVVWRSQLSLAHTSAGASVAPVQSAGAAIGELRRLSGLTWDQLARMFGVSRRSLHFWASGKPITPGHEERLQRILAVLRKIDRGAAHANRTALLSAGVDGSIPFDLLREGDYERALSLLGLGHARRASPPRLSQAARAARALRPPEELVDALHDRTHPTSGRLLAAKPIVPPRRK